MDEHPNDAPGAGRPPTTPDPRDGTTISKEIPRGANPSAADVRDEGTAGRATGTASERPIDAEARKWAMTAHLSALVGLLGNGVGFLLGPLVVWAIKKDDHPFVDRHGKEAINFQLSVILAGAIGVALAFTIIGILVAVPLLMAVAVMAVVFPIVAAVRVHEGEDYRYPITWRFIR